MLFGSNSTKIKVTDRIYISSAAKQTAFIEKLRSETDVIIIAWFDESYSKIQSLISSNNLQTEIYLAREVAEHNARNKTVLFFEHYPLSQKETELLARLQLKETVFYSALDEPLFKYFGGDALVAMVKKLGLSKNEDIEHPMITNAIKNAQEKLAKQTLVEQFAQSQAEWFSKNIVK